MGSTSGSVTTGALTVKVNFEGCPRLEWFTKDGTPFHADSHTRAYAFDAASGAVMHYVGLTLDPFLAFADGCTRWNARIICRPPRMSSPRRSRTYIRSATSSSMGSASRAEAS